MIPIKLQGELGNVGPADSCFSYEWLLQMFQGKDISFHWPVGHSCINLFLLCACNPFFHSFISRRETIGPEKLNDLTKATDRISWAGIPDWTKREHKGYPLILSSLILLTNQHQESCGLCCCVGHRLYPFELWAKITLSFLKLSFVNHVAISRDWSCGSTMKRACCSWRRPKSCS